MAQIKIKPTGFGKTAYLSAKAHGAVSIHPIIQNEVPKSKL